MITSVRASIQVAESPKGQMTLAQERQMAAKAAAMVVMGCLEPVMMGVSFPKCTDSIATQILLKMSPVDPNYDVWSTNPEIVGRRADLASRATFDILEEEDLLGFRNDHQRSLYLARTRGIIEGIFSVMDRGSQIRRHADSQFLSTTELMELVPPSRGA